MALSFDSFRRTRNDAVKVVRETATSLSKDIDAHLKALANTMVWDVEAHPICFTGDIPNSVRSVLVSDYAKAGWDISFSTTEDEILNTFYTWVSFKPRCGFTALVIEHSNTNTVEV